MKQAALIFPFILAFGALPGWTIRAYAQSMSAAPADTSDSGDPILRYADAPAADIDFRGALRGAIETHPRVQQAIANQREAKQAKREARAALFPVLGVGITTDHSLDREFRDLRGNIIEASRPNNRTDANFNAQQLIYDFGATTHRISGAQARIEGAQADARTVAADVGLTAAQAWYDLIASRELVALGRAFLTRHHEILEDVRTRYQKGFGPAGDVARVEAYVADAEGRVAGFDRQLTVAQARVLEAFGTPPPESLGRPASPRGAPLSREEAIALAEKLNTNLQRSAAQTRAAGEDYRTVKATRWPQFVGTVSAYAYDVAERRFIDHDIRAQVIGRYNFFQGGALGARAGQALERVRAAEAADAQIRGEVDRQVSIAWDDVATLELQAATLRRAYLANRRTRDLFAEQFRVARGTLLDVLQSEQDYFEAGVRYIQGLAQLDQARYALLNATGELLDTVGVKLTFANKNKVFGGE